MGKLSTHVRHCCTFGLCVFFPLIPAKARIQAGSPPEFTPDVIGGGDERRRVGELSGTFMIRPSAALALCGAVMSIAALGGCTSSEPPAGEPTFYQNLAQPDVTVDAAAAASMISGYRSNNGLGAVTVDPELMRMAAEQARAMAAHDKMDHDIGRPFQERIRNSPFAGAVAVENISAGYHTLAEAFSGWRDSPPHRANMLNRGVTRLGIAAAFAAGSKYKVFWALILTGPAGHG
jgi:uncharacterized protein YkwD